VDKGVTLPGQGCEGLTGEECCGVDAVERVVLHVDACHASMRGEEAVLGKWV
jgi:hypothetical protein